jgi:DNA invertase Pin-like site-specific DNA recombinase
MKKLVAYYRVSTKRQGRSGLGLDAQRHCVQAFAREHSAKVVPNMLRLSQAV